VEKEELKIVKVNIKGDHLELEGEPKEIIELIKYFISAGQLKMPKDIITTTEAAKKMRV